VLLRSPPIAVGGVFLCSYSTGISISYAARGNKGLENPVLRNTILVADATKHSTKLSTPCSLHDLKALCKLYYQVPHFPFSKKGNILLSLFLNIYKGKYRNREL
ncbi:hypothetical protein, partial [Lacticaseibacillus manihotivorans]|uniref:hypothetical protein n=1 Tax=Lacticaseibacillus manihotivorans TaxID=88233 RepID=UPI001FB3326D